MSRYAADLRIRVRIYAISLFIICAAQILTGVVTNYRQLSVLRGIIGTFHGAFSPIAATVISVNFGSASSRGMSIFNWGQYVGYGFAYLFSKLFEIDEVSGLDWRAGYMITGGIGILLVRV